MRDPLRRDEAGALVVTSAPDGARPLAQVLAERRLPALDGLRAFAVLTVFFYHAGLRALPGDLGVSIFFVLSGFLITRLLRDEWARTGDVSLRRFYLRRSLRIFPAYYWFIAVSIAADAALGARWTPLRMGAALAYGYNYFNALARYAPLGTAHAWSLSVEEQFYLLLPAVFLLLSRRGERALRWGLVAMVLGPLVWRSTLLIGGFAGQRYVYNALDTRLDNLGVGCLLAVLADSPALSRAAAFLARFSWAPLVTVAAVIVSRKWIGPAYHFRFGFTVDALLFGILIVQLLQLSNTRFWRWMDHRLLRWLGAISYPIYLWHIWGIAAGQHLPLPAPLRLLAGLASTIALAAASYYLLEKPILGLRTRLEARLLQRRPLPMLEPT